MFRDFLNKLAGPTPELADDDARLAIAALLVRVARADADYSLKETARVTQILATRYGLDDTAAIALRHKAEALEAEAPDTVRFTRQIKDAIPYEDRLSVITAMWSVVLTDGTRSTEENALLRLVAGLLGIEDIDSNMARQREAQKLSQI